MSDPSANACPAKRIPVFPLACWALGMVALTQLLIAALALAVRFEESRQVRVVEKEVPKIVTVRVPVPTETAEPEGAIVARPPVVLPEAMAATDPELSPNPVSAPAIDDPRSERLIREARQARIAGDMGLAIVKLEAALSDSPDDATVHYELGMVHEAMGIFDTASSYYENVFQMGISKAGSLYEAAAKRLRDGFAQPADLLGKLALGRVLKFQDSDHPEGELVVLTIPIHKAPGAEIEPGDISIEVNFFTRNSRNEITLNNSWHTGDHWTTEPVDWADGEESIRMTYLIPPQDQATSHLLGQPVYYGQVITLAYKGEVMDVDASPRNLAARLPSASRQGEDFPSFDEFIDGLPLDFDPDQHHLLLPLKLPD